MCREWWRDTDRILVSTVGIVLHFQHITETVTLLLVGYTLGYVKRLILPLNSVYVQWHPCPLSPLHGVCWHRIVILIVFRITHVVSGSCQNHCLSAQQSATSCCNSQVTFDCLSANSEQWSVCSMLSGWHFNCDDIIAWAQQSTFMEGAAEELHGIAWSDKRKLALCPGYASPDRTVYLRWTVFLTNGFIECIQTGAITAWHLALLMRAWPCQYMQ